MTPVGVFFICQNEDKCHFVNSATLFRILLLLCIVLLLCAAVMVISQIIFGDIPLLRLFQHCFDVIGTENLHRRGG